MVDILRNIKSVLRNIASSCINLGKNPEEIKLIAVSKKQTDDAIKIAYENGIVCFGENYYQEAINKIITLEELSIEWHFLGAIQSNKAKSVANYFSWVQSVASYSIALELSKHRSIALPPLQILIQVNISNEMQKNGIGKEQLFTLAEEVMAMPRLNLRGIMALPDPKQNLINQFTELHILYNQLKDKYPSVDTLSMGTSSDYLTAIECGATMVRLGTVIFGTRTN